MILNILISTIDDGINQIPEILLPIRSDVKYIVSHQYLDNKFLSIPKELIRDDVLVSQIPGKGLTKSRNNAIRLATGDICVIADDDVRYTNEYFDTILQIYRTSVVDLACFMIYTGKDNLPYKNYPDKEILINSLQDHSPSSIEITFLLKPILEKNILFDERFGLGSWLSGGGENLFVYDAINAELQVKFFPFFIVQHPFESTIKSFSKYHQRRVRVGGALDARLNGWVSIPKAFAASIKYLSDLIRNRKNPLVYIYDRVIGSIYILISKPTQRNL